MPVSPALPAADPLKACPCSLARVFQDHWPENGIEEASDLQGSGDQTCA
jgi:hypothetical protein